MRVPYPNGDFVFHHPCHLWQSVRATPIYPTQTSIERRQSNAARDDHKVQFAMNPMAVTCRTRLERDCFFLLLSQTRLAEAGSEVGTWPELLGRVACLVTIDWQGTSCAVIGRREDDLGTASPVRRVGGGSRRRRALVAGRERPGFAG